MTFSVGSLVSARGREWVVLPDSSDDLLLLRPLGGTEDEVAGILPAVEEVHPARFALPDPDAPGTLGDHASGSLLRDAVRLGFRASAGPFRSFGRIAVEPRSYQLVPLMMSLRQDPVRLLLADDVGIGKTVEALMIARELLDRGEIRRSCVLCPPHLTEQWQEEMADKFHIEADVVAPGTVRRLERGCRFGESVFERYPHVIVSVDFIKSDRRRADFLRACPEFVIVDEAHTCAWGQGAGRHQRHELVKGLSADPNRHLVLVTATPHSGKEDAFRSLLSLLDPSLGQLPVDLAGPANAHHRRRLAQHFVQRRRADVRHYLKEDTAFPDREEREATWILSSEYQHLFQQVLRWARETVKDESGGRHRQRVRWWSALALLRSLGSSPAAAAATLRTRASSADTESASEADEVGRRTVLDLDDEDTGERIDVAPGAGLDGEEGPGAGEARRLREMARAADALKGKADPKLQAVIPMVRELIDEGFAPILFCRFIPTAEYLAEELRKALGSDVHVAAVTGHLPPSEREARVRELGEASRRVLVSTDCLSEGINLQRWFDAVVHYDLSWSPTRHEQREGRVDRFGQDSRKVRVITYYGRDNQIDGIVLDVLLRKHKEIRKATGVAVPVPEGTSDVVEAIFEGLLLREQEQQGVQGMLPGFEELLRPKREELHGEWQSASDRETRSRTMFAQERLDPEEVKAELDAVRQALGGQPDVERFVRRAVGSLGGVVNGSDPVTLELRSGDPILADLAGSGTLTVRFDLPVEDGEVYLGRTHPFVDGLASHLLDGALDPQLESPARRAAVIRTRGVSRRTTLLLLRYRFQIHEKEGELERSMLAEDARLVAFEGAPADPRWLESHEAEALLSLTPDQNIEPDQARSFVARVVEGWDELLPYLEDAGHARGDELREAHRRVRVAGERKGIRQSVSVELPPDLIGVYIYLPVGS